MGIGRATVSQDQECGSVCAAAVVGEGGVDATISTTLFCKMQPEATLPSETIVAESGSMHNILASCKIIIVPMEKATLMGVNEEVSAGSYWRRRAHILYGRNLQFSPSLL